MYKHYAPSMTAAFTVAVSCLVMFGVSAPVMIFVFTWIMLCQFAFIATLPSMSNGMKLSIRMMMFFSIAMLIRQIGYMAVSPVVGESVYVWMAAISSIGIGSLFVYAINSSARTYRTEGITPEEGNRIYLVIKRPKTAIDYLLSVVGNPVSSVSFSVGTEWLRFKAKNGSAERFNVTDSLGYTFIDTGLEASDAQVKAFRSVEHKSWSLSRNCVTSWYAFTQGTYLEHMPSEILPSIYVSRILKERLEK